MIVLVDAQISDQRTQENPGIIGLSGTLTSPISSREQQQLPIQLPQSNNDEADKRAGSKFYPLLPPAIPLAVSSPYLSAWLANDENESARNGDLKLSGRWPQFWPIQFPANKQSAYQLAWSGMIRIDGACYQFLGKPASSLVPSTQSEQLPEILDADQISMTYTSTQTIFEFQAGPIRFKVKFLSPIGSRGDMLRHSLPFSYMTIEIIEPTEEPKNHQIQIYTDIQADWASGDHNSNCTWELQESDRVLSYQVQKKNQVPLTEAWEYPEWGQAIYATPKVPELTTASGYSKEVRSQFVRDGKLNGQKDQDFRKINDREPTFGYALEVKTYSDPLIFVIGHVRDPYVSYVKAGLKELEKRSGYWRSVFGKDIDAIDFFVKDYYRALQDSNELDKTIADDARRLGGENHVAIVSLSARQAMSAMEVTVGKDNNGNFNQSDVLVFLKEISSNGDMSTVDVIFPQFPILAYLDPALLRFMLEPIFQYSESGLYPNKWTVHDLGRYPNAPGHNDGQDEPMPVEEAGNMLIMSLAYYQLSKDNKWLSSHSKILSQWTSFLIKDGLIPAKQLSTDDFAGQLANQTNLALKAIVGIAAMSEISKAVSESEGKQKYKEDDSKKLRNIAESYIEQWIKFSLSEDKTHTKLSYQDDKSWGTLYNLFADRLLNLKLVPKFIYETQTNFYPTVTNQYGLPLDSRHAWAKTDWEMFAAGASVNENTRDLLIGRLVNYLNANRVNAGFPDLYETETGQFPGRSKNSTWRIEFINRPVVGGHFSILALDRFNKINGITEDPFRKGKDDDKDKRGRRPISCSNRVRGFNPFQLLFSKKK
ncbi:hypothetical protein BY996DRAFT_4577608 [Phakopsora pachyrhizi]|nr:hypothetical protein BY996DRAFT_4577608 [Phakopsora pachyrhizi]